MMDAVDEPARTRAQPSLLVRGGLAAGFVLLVVACLAMTIMASRARDAEKWVSHTLSVRASVAQLESALASSEAAQRGYLITRSTSFLDSVNETRAGAAHSAQKLVALTADNAGQNARAQEIRDLVDARMKVLVDVIARRQHGDSLAEVAAFSQNRGQTLSTSIRGKLSDVDRTEADLFRARTAAAAGAQNGLLALAITCIAMAIVVCAASMLAGRRYARSLVAANA
ncbi:MAG: CHASE3 domain-containing protein, partial [Hyphomonadaceae bacterium]